MSVTRLAPLIATGLVALWLCSGSLRSQQPATSAETNSGERDIRFTTTEGTWLSVDVSPDGRFVAFDLLGSIYTIAIRGGQATRLTSGRGNDRHPAFSPDGRSIAFVSDRSGASGLWVVDRGTKLIREVARSSDTSGFMFPIWSRDGAALVIAENVNAGSRIETWPITVSGAISTKPSTAQLIGKEEMIGGQFSLLNGGKDIIVSIGERMRNPEVLYRFQLQRFSSQTSSLTALTNGNEGGMSPLVSPDGNYVVFGARREGRTWFKLLDLRTNISKWLTGPVTNDEADWSGQEALPRSAFTPDGRAVVTSYGGKLWMVAVPSGRVTAIPFTASVERRLAPLARYDHPVDDSTLDVRQLRDARLSPDGRRLAFSALERIYVTDMATRQTVRVTQDDVNEFSPAWSNDGISIAYAVWDGHQGGIRSVNLGAEGVVAPPVSWIVQEGYFYDNLAFAPDGNRLVAVRKERRSRWYLDTGRALQDTIGFLTAQSQIFHPLGEIPSIDTGHIHFSAAFPGDALIYRDKEGLYAYPLEGGEPRRLSKSIRVEGKAGYGDAQLAPDGKHFLVAGNDLLTMGTFESSSTTGAAFREVRRISEMGGFSPTWSADGKSLTYNVGASLFRVSLPQADWGSARGTQTERTDISLSIPKDRPSGIVLLSNARLITMRGREVIENGDLLISGNRISALGPHGSIRPPAGTTVLDVHGTTILPGWVDIHFHLNYGHVEGLHALQAWEMLNPLLFGVTALRDPSSHSAEFYTTADRIAVGQMIGPRSFSTGEVVAPGEDRGHAGDDSSWSAARLAAFVDRRANFDKTELLKQEGCCADGYVNTEYEYARLANQYKLGLTVHNGTVNIRRAIPELLAGTGGLEHIFTTAPWYDDMLRLFATSGVTYTPTLFVSHAGSYAAYSYFRKHDPFADNQAARLVPPNVLQWFQQTRRDRLNDLSERIRYPEYVAVMNQLLAYGGRVALGSHGNNSGFTVQAELWCLASGGMSLPDVLRAATLTGAEAIGHGRDFGSLEVGKLADLQVLDANPLDDIENVRRIRYVMANGRLYDVNRWEQVWPSRRPIKPLEWWN